MAAIESAIQLAVDGFSDETKKWLLDHFVPSLLPRIIAFLDHILSNSSVKIKVDDLQRAEQLRSTIQLQP
jgi:acyl-CoA synthetase (AMP-forming)/AMP-acid ligase II